MRLLKTVTFAIFAIFLTACQPEEQQQEIQLEGKTMGTTYHVKYIVQSSQRLPAATEVQAELDALLKEVNNQMSTYQKDSEISLFNQTKVADQAVEISPDFAKVVAEAMRLNQVTNGALDVTVGPLVNLWGFGPDKRLEREPTAEQINERAQSVGIEKLQLEQGEKPRLRKAHPDLYLDLSAIAKGFGVDKLAEHLEKLGLEHYLVEIGGELRGKGKNLRGEPWRIAIEKPEFTQGTSSQIVIPLDNKGLATSGNYRNFYVDDHGNRLSHIIDPQARAPISHNLASISVIADSAMTADGLSTGLFVLGADKALEIAERENLAVFLIIKQGEGYETKMSSAFAHLIGSKQ